MEYRILRNAEEVIASLPEGSTYTIGYGKLVEANGMVFRVYTDQALQYLLTKYPS